MTETLTRRQTQILDVLCTSVEDRGFPPSIREIGAAVGLASSSSVAHQLAELQRKGRIYRDPNHPRAITILPGPCPGAIPEEGLRCSLTKGHGALKADHTDTAYVHWDEEHMAWWTESDPTPAPDPHHVTQTILASDELNAQGIYGNCVQAAVASLLGWPLDRIPHFAAFADWEAALRLWCEGEGFVCINIGDLDDLPDDQRVVLIGRSIRGYGHAVVGLGPKVIWDPHPSRAGLVEITDAYLIRAVS